MNFWIWLLVILVLVPAVVLWVYSFADLVRRSDIAPTPRTLWFVAILVLPLAGAALYLVFRPARAADIRGFGRRRERSERQQRLLTRRKGHRDSS